MKLFTDDIKKDLEKIVDLIRSGEDLLFITANQNRFLVAREELSDKHATSLNCKDCSISTFHIFSETLELFEKATCYTDIKYEIKIYE
jgi:hypothetical protein